MKSLFRKPPWQRKVLCLFLAIAFLNLTVSCSHSYNKSTKQQDRRSEDFSAREGPATKANSGEDPWWKKPEYEWLIATLIVIGIGIAAGASIMISSGGGGLSIRVQK